MAHLIFIAKNRDLSSFQLNGPAMMGRSVENDIYTPDVFVSRQHCRFEKVEEGWAVIDQRSRNGIYFNGKRVYRRVIRHGDLIEIGSFSVRFDKGDIPDNMSTPTPFGEGTGVASLMDTLFTGGLRPAEYLRKSKKKPAWVRAKEEAQAALVRVEEEAAALARAELEKLNFADGTELDLELQIKGASEPLFPQFVLVPREILQQFNDLLEHGVGANTSARPVSPAVAGLRQAIAGSLSIDADSVAQGKATAFAAGTNPRDGASNGVKTGPGVPTGAAKDLWAGVFNEIQEPKTAGGKKKDKVNKAAREGAAGKEAKTRRSALVLPKAPIGERFKDLFEWAKTVDVSMNGMLGLVSGNPKPFIASGAAMVLILGGLLTYSIAKPKYHQPDLSRFTPAQIAEINRQSSN